MSGSGSSHQSEDLRTLSVSELDDNLRRLGVSEAEIERLARWEKVSRLRELIQSQDSQTKET